VNAVLEAIVKSQQVLDGATPLPLRHPDFPELPVAVDDAEGAWLQRVVADIEPNVSLEIGCAYGVSSLYICESLAGLAHPATHIVIDPFQRTQWRGIGLTHLRDAGFSSFVDFREERSEIELPRLLAAGVTIDFAFVDGRHTFDQVMLEFYYLNRLLRIGGVIAFDDADRRSVNRAVRHALTYPCYRAYGTPPTPPARTTLLGRGRKALTRVPLVAGVLRPDIVRRDWDLGILGSCVAIQKTDEDRRSSGWDSNF